VGRFFEAFARARVDAARVRPCAPNSWGRDRVGAEFDADRPAPSGAHPNLWLQLETAAEPDEGRGPVEKGGAAKAVALIAAPAKKKRVIPPKAQFVAALLRPVRARMPGRRR